MLRLTVILGLVFAPWVLADETILLGVLEEPQCAKDQGIRGRILFASDRGRWESLASRDSKLPIEIPEKKWTVALDGKVLGMLALMDPTPGAPQTTDWFYARDKLYLPVGKYPSVKSRGSFGGWCEAPSTRPLVLISQPLVEDPAGWKPLPVTNDYRQRLYGPMRLVLGRMNVFRCRDPEGAIPEPFDFQPEDLKLYKGYRSKTDGILVSVGLDPEKYGCDGVSEPAWLAHWFLLHNEQVDFIANGMELVDAGDYDSDGKSELLFWRSGYNRDGYVLVFDDLRQKAEYTWGYH